MTNDTLTGLSVEEAEELHRNLIQGTQFFGMIAALAHLLAYIHLALLNNTTWVKAFLEGGQSTKSAASSMAPAAPLAKK